MKIHAFGDSFVMGDQDDFLEETKWIDQPTHGMAHYDRVQYLRHNVSFASHIACRLNAELINYAVGGCGNQMQIDYLYNETLAGNISADDIVLFGFTTSWRGRVLIRPAAERAGLLINLGDNSFNDEELICRDCLYAHVLTSKLQQQYQFKLIAFNLFHNVTDSSEFYKHLLGYQYPTNTLIDILNDTWGQITHLQIIWAKFLWDMKIYIQKLEVTIIRTQVLMGIKR